MYNDVHSVVANVRWDIVLERGIHQTNTTLWSKFKIFDLATLATWLFI